MHSENQAAADGAHQTQQVAPRPQNHANSAYATIQPGGQPSDNNQSQPAKIGGNHPKVPPLAFHSTFNLAEAPLRRLEDDKSKSVSGLSGEVLPNVAHYLSTAGQQVMTTEMDAQKRPPVTVKQTDIIFLPDKGCQDAVLAFDVSRKQAGLPPVQTQMQSIGRSGSSSARQRGGSTDRSGSGLERGPMAPGASSYRGTSVAQPMVSHHYQDFGDLMLLSRQEASLMHRMHVRDNLQARAQLGCKVFQNEMKRGCMAVGTSPDGHCVALLTREFAVLVHDKVKEKTYFVPQIPNQFFSKNQVTIQSLIEQKRGARSGEPSDDSYKVQVSNNVSTIYVVSASERLVATWTQSFNQKDSSKAGAKSMATEISKQKKNQDSFEAPKPTRVPLQRSNSASKAIDRTEKSRSTSRLRSFFLGSPRKEKEEKPQAKVQPSSNFNNKVAAAEMQPTPRSQSASRTQEAGPAKNLGEQPEQLKGTWTNITLHSLNKQELTLMALATANSVHYNLSVGQEASFSSGLPTRLGASRSVNQLSEFQLEECLVSVKMYDWAAYVNMFDCKLQSDLTGENSPRSSVNYKRATFQSLNEQSEADSDTRKVLVFSRQAVEQDKVHRGNAWYQNPFYLVDKVTLSTEIDFMGVLPSEPGRPNKTLIARCDNQGNLVAVVVNSVHKIYCQVMFVSLRNQFVSAMKLFDFVSAEDNPPFDSKGKTNLQVDDFAWTRNDAFLVLMFNTGALAVLPRLGSQLLQVFNPTIINVHFKDAAQFTHYKVPRGFNELIPKNEIAAKVKKHRRLCQNNGSTGYRIAAHPSEEAFIVYSGCVAYLLQLELEPELQELFEAHNKNYYFMRFCFSMRSLAKDQETLAKVPQLLTSKLPICEFDKNQQQLDSEVDHTAAKRIETASQINPWQMQDRRMDTLQSFDAEFSADSEQVLLNFKHLLFAYRWNGEPSLNYLEWLVTVTNDIFFYFLKQSEPMYAYHTLKLSEYYMQRVFQNSHSVSQFNAKDPRQTALIQELQTHIFVGKSQKRPSSDKKEAFKRIGKVFQGLNQRLMDPVIEVYTNGLASKTLQAETYPDSSTEKAKEDFENVLPAELTLADKIKTENNFLKRMPLLVAEGDGSTGFSFQKNYILLAYYCLIQFRNYQASNFNILFLILSSYIVKSHVNSSFIEALQRFTVVILQNFTQLEKTDELDLFFGKCGRNVISEPSQAIHFVQSWIRRVVPHQAQYMYRLLGKGTLQELQALNYDSLLTGGQRKSIMSKGQTDKEVKSLFPKKNFSDMVQSLASLDLIAAANQLKNVGLAFRETRDQYHLTSPTQTMGVLTTFFANALYHILQGSQRRVKSLSAVLALDSIAKMALKMDKKSPINTVSQHTKIFDSAFIHNVSPKVAETQMISLMKYLKVNTGHEMRKLTAMLLAYSGDFQRAASLLKPSSTSPASLELLIFNLLIQASALKAHSKSFLYLREKLADYSMKKIKDFRSLHQTTERLNAMHTIKFTMAEVSCTVQRVTHLTHNSLIYKEYLWACFAMLPLGVSIVFKEQIARDTLGSIKALLAFQTKNERSELDLLPQDLVISEFPFAKAFFHSTLDDNFEHLEYVLPVQKMVRRRFFHLFEILLVCFYDQHKDQVLFETTQELSTKRRSGQHDTAVDQQSTDLVNERVISLIQKDLQKFVKIFCYLKIRTDMKSMDQQILQYRHSNPQKVIEAQIVLCCKSLQHMVQFPKYVNVQAHVKRALILLIHLLFHTEDKVRDEVRQKVLLPVLAMIRYNKLARPNKQIVNSMLEMCKAKRTRLAAEELVNDSSVTLFEAVTRQLECIIYENQASSGPQVDPSNPIKLKSAEETDSQEFKEMIVEVSAWLIYQKLPALNFKRLNKRGHRRCIDAKKDLFKYASIMNLDLGIPMTDTSLYYRGVNFEIKHVNVFGVAESDLLDYLKLLEADEQEAEATAIAAKGKGLISESAKATQVIAEDVQAEQASDSEGEGGMNQTRVEKLADQSVMGQLKDQMQQLPNLDLEAYSYGLRQLNGRDDLPASINLSDAHTISGLGYLNMEIRVIQNNFRQKMREQTEAKKEEREVAAGTIIVDLKSGRHTRNSSVKNKPSAFQNSISLTELSTDNKTQASGQSQTSKVDELEAQETEQDRLVKAKSLVERGAKFNLGRILAKQQPGSDQKGSEPSAVSKITLRKNSARRRLTTEEIKQVKPRMPKTESFGLPPKARRKANEMQSNDPQKEDPHQSEAREEAEQKKRHKTFNLVLLKKTKTVNEKGTEESASPGKAKKTMKVKMPFKLITKQLAKQSLEAPNSAQEDPDQTQAEQQPPRKEQKVKPFQVQLVKINKSKAGGAVKIVSNAQQQVCDLSRMDKHGIMNNLLNKIDRVQSKTEALQKVLKDNDANQDSRQQD